MKLLARLLLVLSLLFGGALQPVRADLLSTGVGAGYSTLTCGEATTFLARTSGLDATHTAAYTNLICGLVANGLWSGIDVLYVMSTQDSTTAGLNLKSASYTLTPTNTPTFTADQGYAGNGTTSYEASAYNPGDGGGPYQYTRDNASIFVWVRDYGSQNQAMAFGSTTTDGQRVGVGSVGHTPGGRANSGTTLQSPSALAAGFVAINRSSSASNEDYAAGTPVNTDTAASVAVLNESWGIGKVRGLFTTQQVSIAGAGRSFSAVEHAQLYQIFCGWQKAVGAASC